MTEHQHNEPFKEAYWDEALRVLEQEERKQRRRRIVPIFFSATAAVVLVLILVKWTTSAPHVLLTIQPFEGPAVERLSNDQHLESSAQAPREQWLNEGTPSGKTKQNIVSHTSGVGDGHEASEASAGQDQTEIQQQKRMPQPEPEGQLEAGSADNTKSILNKKLPPTKQQPFQTPSISTGLLLANQRIVSRPSQRIENGLTGVLIRKPFIDRHRAFLSRSTSSTPITVYGGNAFAPGYGSRKASAWNPQFGIALEQRVANTLWLRVAAGGQQISQTFASKSYVEEQASFGYEATETVISTNRLYLLDIPIGLVWDAFLRHSVLMGGGAEVILRTDNTLAQTKINAFGIQELGEEETYGYLTGYRALMYNLNIGYRYRFSKRNSLDVVASTGFHAVNEVGSSKNGRISVRFNFQIK